MLCGLCVDLFTFVSLKLRGSKDFIEGNPICGNSKIYKMPRRGIMLVANRKITNKPAPQRGAMLFLDSIKPHCASLRRHNDFTNCILPTSPISDGLVHQYYPVTIYYVLKTIH
jgi:hypothetical protein